MKMSLANKMAWLCVMSIVLLLGGAFALYCSAFQPKTDVEAFTSSSDTSTYINIGELLNDPTTATGSAPFNETNLTTLINMINNNTTGGIAGIKSTIQAKTPTSGPKAITASDLRTNTQGKSNGQSIIVRLGGLDWIVTFVSLDTSGNVIATLWLNNNYQSKWASESDVSVGSSSSGQYKITSGKLTSTWSAGWSDSGSYAYSYPSNMYGTSYVRVETLNNPNNRTYATNNSTIISGTTQGTTTSEHPFALYTYSGLGLTPYLTTPNQMSWINNLQDPCLRGFDTSYNFYNESLSTSGGNYAPVTHQHTGGKDMTDTPTTTGAVGTFSNSITTGVTNKNKSSTVTTSATTYDTTIDENSYTLKDGYTNWGTDYLWIPSMVETGYTGESAGLWATNTAERAASYYSWSRSVDSRYAYYGLVLYSSGSSYSNYNDVYSSYAVRPALLLNLTKIASTMPVDFNVTVTASQETNYFDSNGDSYGPYETSKSKLIVQICDLEDNIIDSHTYSKLWGANGTSGTDETYAFSLTPDTFYIVHIFTPTFLRYEVNYNVDSSSTISYNCNTFTIYCTGEQGIEVNVFGLQDNSWITFFGT